MKGFKVHDGDVVVNKTIEMVDGAEFLRQTVELVIGTNKGEWYYDQEEGIDYSLIFRKNPSEDEIRTTIEEALIKVDETFVMTDFRLTMNGRHATINFTAVNDDGEEVGGEYTYGG